MLCALAITLNLKKQIPKQKISALMN